MMPTPTTDVPVSFRTENLTDNGEAIVTDCPECLSVIRLVNLAEHRAKAHSS
jgi:hypothetical protein